MDGLIALALAKKYTDEHGGGGGGEGVKYHSGSGAPISSIVANTGDLYMDTTNNKLYECIQYIDPSLVTKLDGLKITLKTTGNFPANGMTNYQFDKGGITAFGYTNGSTSNQLRELTVTNNQIQVVAWNYGSTRYTLIDGSGTQKENLPIYTGGMLGNPAKIAFNNDINLDNQEVVKWFIENAADIEGLGSQWVEVVAKDTRLPAVSSTDNGKILKVDSGAWSTQSETKELPAVSGTDNGKLLGVNNGAWAKVSAPTELPTVTSADEGKVLQVNSSGSWVAALAGGMTWTKVYDAAANTNTTYNLDTGVHLFAHKLVLIATYTNGSTSTQGDYAVTTILPEIIPSEVTTISVVVTRSDGARIIKFTDTSFTMPNSPGMNAARLIIYVLD